MVYGNGGFRQLWRASERLILPATCVACGESQSRHFSSARLDLCDPCGAALPLNTCACVRCGLPLSGSQNNLLCGACIKRPPPYELSYCAFEYAYPIEHLIRRCKYGGALAVARVLGNLLACYLEQRHDGVWPSCIVPMPLHVTRYRTRGYNQVIEIGRELQSQLGIVMRTDLVERIRNTPEQAGLSRRARRKNLRKAFVAKTALPEHICILDDVVTTSSSVNAVALTLKRAGVQRVEVWSVARASLHARQQS